MSKIILSLIGQNSQKSLPNILFRLSGSQFNYFATSSSSLHTYQQSQYITNSKTNLSKLQEFNSITKSNLYTDVSLGIYKLDTLRENRTKLYETGKDRYIERIAKYVENGEIKSIFKDDLINLIALAENETHLDLIEKIAVSTKGADDASVGTWGSAVMRLYYKMNQIDRAINNLKDIDTYGEFFNQRTSYQIVMTMLYNAGRYQDLIDIYELSINRLSLLDVDRKYQTDRRLSMLAFAAYAKINTPEALEAAQILYAKDPNNPYLKMRVITFLSYLAVNQDKAAAALNLLSDSPHKNYISAREIKTISLIKLKRYEDVLYHIRESISETKREFKIMIQEVCDLLESRKDEIDDEQVKTELMNTLVELKQSQLISDATLESIVFKEVNQDARERILFRQDNNINMNNMRRPYNRMRFDNRSSAYGGDRNDRWSNRDGFRQNRTRNNRFDDDNDFEDTDSGSLMYNNRGGRNTSNDNNRQNNYNRGGRRPAKSYFEDDLEDDIDLGQVNADKRFR